MSNQLLSRLSRADFRLLEPHLAAVDLPVRKMLGRATSVSSTSTSLTSGIASVVSNGAHALEIGIVGRDGMTGVSVVFGSDERARHETYMQVAGSGQRLPADQLRQAMEASASLLKALLLYAIRFMTQTTDTAVANGRHKIEERLARWLLMVSDRIEGNEVPLTHEFLGTMIGTARPGVTIAIQELQRRGWISNSRGVVTILDREGLTKSSNGAYVAPNDK